MSDEPRPLARWTIRDDEDGRTLCEVLRDRVPDASPDRIRAAIETRVRLSWSTVVEADTRVVALGVIELLPEPLDEVPDETPIPVLARGSGWIAVDKPAGVPVHPSRSVRINSVVARVRRAEGDTDLRLVHRLDRDTSGVLLLARDRATAGRLGRAFASGAVCKTYLAVVQGVPDRPRGVVDAPVGPHPTSRVRVRMAAGAGRPAVTRWEALGQVAGGTLLRIVPETGRRHQIRVHLESIGHPIVGDILYGRPDDDYLALVEGRRPPRPRGLPSRMLLHCGSLRLEWPGLGIDVRSSFRDLDEDAPSGRDPESVRRK